MFNLREELPETGEADTMLILADTAAFAAAAGRR